MNLTLQALLFTLASIGISETAYLIRVRRAATQPVCPIGQDCSKVLTSRYNRLFGVVHNDVLGFLFYGAFAVLTAFMVLGVGNLLLWELTALVLLAGATVASTVFTYLQARVIRAWCFWCVMSAATVALMDAVIIAARLS